MELGAATGGILIPIWAQSYNRAPECAITGSKLALIGSGAAVTAWMRRTMKRSAETEAVADLALPPDSRPATCQNVQTRWRICKPDDSKNASLMA